jgi:ABC-type dipeptide/oligopeptide/nickel transport system permease subunit
MSDAPKVVSQDYWSIVFRQLRKARLGLAGLGVVFVLYLIAVAAPFLAESKPLRVVHDNPEDKICFLCRDLGLSYRRLTLKDGRVLEGKMIRRVENILTFEHGGKQENLDVPKMVAKNEEYPRRHDRVVTHPLLRSLTIIDRYLLLSLFCILLGAPVYFISRRHGRTRFLSNRRALITVAPFILAGALGIHLSTSDLNRLNQTDFRAMEKKRIKPTDSVTWALIRHAPTDIDKRVIPLSKPWPWTLKAEEQAQLQTIGEDWEAGLKSHPLGTDDQRRDVLSMMIHATRVSLSVGFFSVAIYVTLGVVLGALAGYYGGWVDSAIMRVIEIIMCFPTLFLIITILAIVDPSIFWVMGTIAFVGWTTVARLVRAEFLKLRQLDFVQSARALGASRARIIFRHILPNGISPVFVSATFGIAGAILTESSLSFLGIGIPVDQPTWGNVLRAGRQYVETDWWLALWPGVAIFLTVTSFNLFGEALRDSMDPRLKGTQ